MVNLESLDLSHNQIYGQLPSWTVSMRKDSLSYLNISHYFLTSLDPPHLWVNLQVLDLRSNLLQGPLISSVCDLSSLIVLDLSASLMQFPIVLILRANRFHSSIRITSKTMLLFGKLRILDLSHNEFTGLVPPNYFSSFKAMINVRENKTAGMYINRPYSPAYYYSINVAMKGIEIELVKFLNVFTTIDLSSNQFGGIPNSTGNLNSL
ncbi:hypothetical protein LguiB_029402 [Lonicera macranthoides]